MIIYQLFIVYFKIRVFMKKRLTILSLVVAFLFPSLLFGQGRQIQGSVVDKNNEPLAGVSVMYKGTSTGVSTDMNGKFSIKSLPNGILLVSFLGMKDVEIPIKNQSQLRVVMEESNNTLDDVVVIGYAEVSRKDLTGSISSVSSESIKKSGSSNVMGALQGHVAGLTIVSQSGEPGSGYQIKIRGNNSINAGTSPLFVIDGMQMDVSSGEIASSSATGSGTYDPLAFINPSDIQSVEVLKDASATAIYGARGANGVVLITTKSGSSLNNSTVVTFDASLGISKVPKHIDMLDAQDYINYRFSRKDYGWTGYGADTNGDDIPDTPLDASGYEHFDWQKLMYRTALTQNYNVSVSAVANQKTKIMTSIGYLDQEGLVKNNDYKRYTGRIKIDHNINQKVKVGGSLSYGRNVSNGAVSSGGGSLGYSGLIQCIYLERPVKLYTDSETDYSNGWISLMDMISDETYRKTVYQRTAGNAYLNWIIIPELVFRAQASGNTSNSKLTEFYSMKSRWGRSRNGYGAVTSVDQYSYNASAQLTYKKQWGDHNFSAMAGVELSKYHLENMKVSAYDFAESSTGAFDLSKAGVIEAPSSSINQSTRMSAFGRLDYNYKSKYYATFNMRADGSSKFHAGNRVGYFPSVSVAWRANEEEFLEPVKWLDNLKLRLSAGATGNDRVSTYAALALMTTNYYAQNGNEIMGMAPSTSANPKLKWETTYQYDLGLDLSVLDNRINLTTDIYYKDTRDMLYSATLSAQSGFTQQWQNLGKVENKGLEVSFETHNIQTKAFSWDSNITFDMSRNKVRDIGGISYTSINIGNGQLSNDISRIMVGKPIGIGYGYVCEGNYQLDDFNIVDKFGNELPSEAVTSENLDNFTYKLKDGVTKINSVTVLPGDRKYKDLDGDGEVTSADRTVISDSNPDFTFGFGNSFAYKNFDLNIFFEGVYGRDIMNEFKLRSESGQSGGTQYNNLRHEAWDGRWTPENGSNKYSRLLNQTNTYVSSYYVEDGSFIRLKTVSLGYSLPNFLLKRAKIKSVRFYVSGENLFVLTKYSGMDPDVSSSNQLFTGFDRMSYPKARTITFGINANF